MEKLFLAEEEDEFRSLIREWVDDRYPKSRARELEDSHEYPFALWKDLAEAGFHGIGISEEYGGQAGGVRAQAILGQGLARNLAGLVTVWGISSFAGAKAISAHGSEEQKQRFLPRIAVGEYRFAIAITEPGGGTDLLGAMSTKAVRAEDGWRLSGQKIWSTGAHVADYILVLARTDLMLPAHKGSTLFIVARESDGLQTRLIPKLGIRSVGSNEVFLDDVFVPDDLVLGDLGSGWKNVVSALNNERILTAAFATGVIEGVRETAVEYMGQRHAFGGPIARFQALQHYVADMLTWQRQSELLTLYAADLQEMGRPCGVESTMAKSAAAEYASQASDLGIQILGGMGYAMETDMQRYWRDSRIFRIAPITTEMAKNMIAQSAGLPRSY